MLAYNEYEEKDFERMLDEAIAQIPMYTEEWTSRNVSDLGITILENLTAFNALQQSYIHNIDIQTRLKLLALAGIYPKSTSCARIFLQSASDEAAASFPANQKFVVGDMCFETDTPICVGNYKITNIFCAHGNEIISHQYMLDRSLPVSGMIFGDRPAAGDKLYMIINDLPQNMDKLLIYVEIDEKYKRNAFCWDLDNPFAKIQWQLYTADGFVNIEAVDKTSCFMRSGLLTLRLPQQKAALYSGSGFLGYAVRGVLDRADYDLAPSVKNIFGFLFEAWQRDSKAICYTFRGKDCIEIDFSLLEQSYISVFCMENEENIYYKYTEAAKEPAKGRFYTMKMPKKGQRILQFSGTAFGFAPCTAANAVKVVLYDDEMMRWYHLGEVLGYDQQKIKLPLCRLIPERFEVIAKKKDSGGGEYYSFFKAGDTREGALTYEIDAEAGILCIRAVGNYINADLYIAGLAVTAGEKGNMEAGKTLYPAGFGTELTFINAAAATGGRNADSAEQLEKQFAVLANQTETAVTAQDYERLAFLTPGICLSKVNAIVNKRTNSVDIIAVPLNDEKLPKLTHLYKDLILQHLNHYRLLSTVICVHSADYAAVDVSVQLRVKNYYADCKAYIEKQICRCVDYLHSNRQFGEALQYERVFDTLYALDCVQDIIELSFSVENQRLAKKSALDIVPDERCLLYPGNMNIVIEKG